MTYYGQWYDEYDIGLLLAEIDCLRAALSAAVADTERLTEEVADQRMVIAHQRDMRHAETAGRREAEARAEVAERQVAELTAELAWMVGHRDERTQRLGEAKRRIAAALALVNDEYIQCQSLHLCSREAVCLVCKLSAALTGVDATPADPLCLPGEHVFFHGTCGGCGLTSADVAGGTS